MRIFKLVPLACAALMMGACASENEGNGGNTNESVNEQYLAVNIKNVGTTPTRTAPGDYEDGTDNESKIERIRFYFYNTDGTPYIMKNSPGTTVVGTKANWLEATTSKDRDDKPNTIEQITNSILVIDGETAAAPAKVVAVVNPGTLTTLGDASVSLDDLRSVLEDTQFKKNQGASAVEFVMSNSVYAKDAATVCETQISGHVEKSSTAAENNPVDIYVERVVAKVKANLNTTTATEPFVLGDGTTNWETGKYGIKVGTYNSTTDVYAVIDGWGVADENGKAMLEKQIEPSWTDTSLGITPWSTPDYKRSFWETSVAFAGTNKLVNHKFTDYEKNAINTKTSYLYTLPNTPTAAITNKYENDLTKFLVVAHLMYKDGTTWKKAEICHYKGIDYLGVENLQTQIAEECGVYVQSATSPATYTKITKDDITFAKSASAKDYQVVPKLADDGKTYYVNTGTTSAPHYTTKTAADINTELAKSPAQVRTEGKVYYFIPIKHLGIDGSLAEYGIVRNHLYNITLDKIVGFGTPVYNPDEIIDPTVPVDEHTYLAARINVLQWRVVNQKVDLDYSK